MKGACTFLLIAFVFWWVALETGEVMSERDWWIAGGLTAVCLVSSFTDWVLKNGRPR